MRVLIGCERSGAMRRAFRARGHDAWSCDLEPADDGSPYHLQFTVFAAVEPLALGDWDLGIFHPPCTHLSVSGAAHFAAKRADGRQQAAVAFFIRLADSDIPRKVVEQPISIMSSAYRKPDQVIQPWQFGHDASKATCLWLTGLPRLTPTRYIEPRLVHVSGKTFKRWGNQTDSGQNRLPPTADRAQIRSETYAGIADAMADQWGELA